METEMLEALLGLMREFLDSAASAGCPGEDPDKEEALGTMQSAWEEGLRLLPEGRKPCAPHEHAWHLVLETYSFDDNASVRAFATQTEARDCLRRQYAAERLVSSVENNWESDAEHDGLWLRSKITDYVRDDADITLMSVAEVRIPGIPPAGKERPHVERGEASFVVEGRFSWLDEKEWEACEYFPDEASARAFLKEEAEGVLKAYIEDYFGYDCSPLPYVKERGDEMVLCHFESGAELYEWRVRPLKKS